MLFALHPVLAPGAHVIEPALDLLGDFALAKPALLQVEADQRGNRGADRDQLVGQFEQLLVAIVPRDEVHLGIDQRNALVDILDRELQEFGAERESPVGLVEHRHHFVERDGRALGPRRHQHPRRGRADHPGNGALGHAYHRCVGPVAVAIWPRHGRQRFVCPTTADELRQQHADIGDPSPRAVGRRQARRRTADEGRGLRGIDQRRAREARSGEIRRDIGAEADQHARHQRVGVNSDHGRTAGRRRQDQQHHPSSKPRAEPSQHPDAVAAAAQHAEHQAGRELRHRREGQRPQPGKVGQTAEFEVEQVGEQKQPGDHQLPHAQELPGQLRSFVAAAQRLAEQQRADQIVGDHRRQRDAGNHDHPGRG